MIREVKHLQNNLYQFLVPDCIVDYKNKMNNVSMHSRQNENNKCIIQGKFGCNLTNKCSFNSCVIMITNIV